MPEKPKPLVLLSITEEWTSLYVFNKIALWHFISMIMYMNFMSRSKVSKPMSTDWMLTRASWSSSPRVLRLKKSLPPLKPPVFSCLLKRLLPSSNSWLLLLKWRRTLLSWDWDKLVTTLVTSVFVLSVLLKRLKRIKMEVEEKDNISLFVLYLTMFNKIKKGKRCWKNKNDQFRRTLHYFTK